MSAEDATPVKLTEPPSGYADWLADLKTRIHSAQQRAALAVNRELVLLYWQIGQDILARQAAQGWGAKVIERLSQDLRSAFPEMKGFSRANLMYMRAFAAAWPDEKIVQQAVGQLPWGHNLVLLSQLKDPAQRLAYAESAIEHGWSRNVLNIHIETRLLERSGKAVTNFSTTLPAPQSDLARESLKDPYRFDFLGLSREAVSAPSRMPGQTRHRVSAGTGRGLCLRRAAGAAGCGRRRVFHRPAVLPPKLRCYVVIELKGGKFKPEHLGQLSFYLTAVDEQIKHPQDNPTIGLLLCKSKNKVVAEYALRQNTQPLGVAEYKLIESLPPELATDLPSIEQIERN
jgi:predicted nuclease of restriction endonuclease-like (RecB) superfamily